MTSSVWQQKMFCGKYASIADQEYMLMKAFNEMK